ncbi:MAG TPA: MFS transporter [Euzebyales bacterium]|nr:MFS transporter [Euzebyales bacterium]
MLPRTPSTAGMRTRLLPLYIAVGLQGFMLWVPIEKLFMSEIGFDPADVGVMAVAYSAFVPIVEMPSGLLADRWSRRGVLVLASVALALTSLIGGMSTNVPAYIGSALLLGVYFAMYSGTMDAVVYDTVLEEVGDSDAFERQIGRVRLAETVTLVASSLLGGWIANVATPRLTYFMTVPFALLSIVAFLRFREPQLHKTEEPVPLRRQLVVTYRTLIRNRTLLPSVALAVLTAMIMQTMFEFGPLWLVAFAVPAVAFGPYWAGLVSTMGVGGLLAGRFSFDRRATTVTAGALLLAAAATLAVSTQIVVLVVAQMVLATLLMIASISVTRRVHDAVPSSVRSGVASGLGAVSWLAFLPFALGTGLVIEFSGVRAAGGLVAAVTVVTAALWLVPALRRAPAPLPEEAAAAEVVRAPAGMVG